MEKDVMPMKNADAVWPERLKFLRKSNNLSQTDVAGVLHCSQAAYGMYELGKRKISADKLLILAQYPLKIGFQQESGVFISFRRIAMS